MSASEVVEGASVEVGREVSKLRQQGHYQPMATTNPAQSPVAWASFATGLNPGAHGIFDFLSRNAQTYGPDYSIASVTPATAIMLRSS